MPRVRRFALSLVPCLACAGPPAAPGSTSATTETPAASTSESGTDTSAAASSTDTSSGSGSSSASQGEADTTAANTTAAPLCGDGVLDPGEQCDLGAAAHGNDAKCLFDCTLATCGDGHVFANVEECDDQNFVPADGCHECGRTRIVFVTSDAYQPGSFMGMGDADQRCRSLAAQAGLKNFAGFKAWLSDSTTSAKQRMVHGRGRYELVNGLLVADSWEALVAGELQNPIVVTETSETHENGVWTGTNPDGTTAEGTTHCLDWTYTGVQHTAHYGANSETSPSWTLAETDANPTDCTSELPIYCFEQD